MTVSKNLPVHSTSLISQTLPKSSLLVSLAIENSRRMSVGFSANVFGLCVCATAHEFRRVAVIVFRRYVFSLLKAEKLRSADALDAGKT